MERGDPSYKAQDITAALRSSRSFCFSTRTERSVYWRKGWWLKWTIDLPQVRTLLTCGASCSPCSPSLRLSSYGHPGSITGIIVGALPAQTAAGGMLSGLLAALTDAFSSKWNGGFWSSPCAHRPRQRGAAKRRDRRNRQSAGAGQSRRDAETATVAPAACSSLTTTPTPWSSVRPEPLTDCYGTSCAKLAYLVDSTAAPLAGIALLSTWIGYEVGLLQDLSKSSGSGWTATRCFSQRSSSWLPLALLLVLAGLHGARPRPDDRAQRSCPLVGR